MTTPPQRLVAALDLGSTKVVAVIAEVTGDAREPGAKILGLGVERSGGIRRGVVRDIEETTRAIERAMKSAQRMAGVEVGSIYCGLAGEHVAGRTSHGMVSVTGDEIRTGDVARVNDMASSVSFGRDHELLHAIPQDYLIDQQGGISEPIGMTGSRLEAEVYLVTVLSSVLLNLRKCVERAGYQVETAPDGSQGVDRFAARPGHFDAILLDLTMPVMNGQEALERILAIRPEVPVILSSGFSEDEALRRFHGRGLAGFLQKPYTAATLARKVRQATGGTPVKAS